MDKKTKMWLGAAAVAALAFYLYKRQSSTSSFVGFTTKGGLSLNSGKSTAMVCKSTGGPGDPCQGPAGNICGESCMNGTCNVPVYDENGKISFYVMNQACPSIPRSI